VEDFLGSMEEAGGRSLAQFARWYHQSGTPEVTLENSAYDPAKQTLDVTFSQKCNSTPNQPAESKQPFHIPISIALLGTKGPMLEPELETDHKKPLVNGNGHPLESGEPGTHVLELREKQQSFRFVGVPQKPVLSMFRGFSAPVKFIAKYARMLIL
jgi:aminopeptidase N